MSNAQTLRAQLAAKEQEVAAKQLEVAALREQVAAALTAEREEVISELLEKILAHNIGSEDLFPTNKIAPAAGPTASDPAVRKKGEPVYRDPATGATWTGRGKPPRWIAGKDKAQFLIVAQTVGPATSGANMPGEASTVAVSADNAVASAVPAALSSGARVDVATVHPAEESALGVPAFNVNAPSNDTTPSTLAIHEELTPDPALSTSTAEADSGAAHPNSGSAVEAKHDGRAQVALPSPKAVVEQ